MKGVKIAIAILILQIVATSSCILIALINDANAEKYDSFYSYSCPIGTKELVFKLQRPVSADRLNCRSYPSTNASINKEYEYGEWVTIIALYDDWALVGLSETRPQGWVYAKYVGYDAAYVYSSEGMVTDW